jgi:tetratricopeptide (TPR) repeat protein
MKAQRRQELKTNTLAEELAEIVVYLKNQSQAVTVAAVAVLVILGVLWYWHRTVQTRRAEGWQVMLGLMATSKQKDPQVLDKMEQVAASYSDPQFKAMAYAQLGDRLRAEAAMAETPEVARDYASRAESAFQAALNVTPDQIVPAAIARLGLASLAADKGDFDTAKRYYEAVGNDANLAGTPFPAQASAALTALEAARKLPPLAPTSQPVQAAVPASQPAQAAAEAMAPVPSAVPAQAGQPASPAAGPSPPLGEAAAPASRTSDE